MALLHLENDLHTYFKKQSFLPGQQEIIEDVLSGKDVLGILPTGSGKSLCYQLPAKKLSGSTIVVSPLISLMTDQVKQLKANQFKEVIALNSFMKPVDRKATYPHLDSYKLIYVSPELLQQDEVLYWLKKITVCLFVIDEAHCISQWGHEFRPDYLRLKNVIAALQHPTVLALSATVTREVREDIKYALEKPEMIQHIYPIDRKNIIYNVQKVTSESEKTRYISEIIRTHRIPVIIYFSSRQLCEQVAETLSRSVTTRQIAYYHGGLEQLDRTLIQQQFMNDQIDVVCATSAFGMGIDKQNIRMVIHYHLPSQLESFIQETGRAGRDGESSVSLLLYNEQDKYIPKRFIKRELPTTEDMTFVWKRLAELHHKGQSLPMDENEICRYFQLSDIQWRFLFYQIRRHGMIQEKEIIFNKMHWEEVFCKVKGIVHTRIKQKKDKLREMIDWISTSDCLRQELYQGFQSTYTVPDDFCCSNCGFIYGNWKPTTTNKVLETKSWQKKLKKILIENVPE